MTKRRRISLSPGKSDPSNDGQICAESDGGSFYDENESEEQAMILLLSQTDAVASYIQQLEKEDLKAAVPDGPPDDPV